MAKIRLLDGTHAPVVKPHLGDQMELERQMRATNKKYGAADFKNDVKLSGFQTAFTIFASYRRAGEPYGIVEILELDFEELSALIQREPGDPDPDADEDDDEAESEGEQGSDPQLAPTAAADAAAE